jgi:hypothetical protein
MFKKATKIRTSAAVVSPYPLSSTPSTSSAMKTQKRTRIGGVIKMEYSSD